jgi:predicted permease
VVPSTDAVLVFTLLLESAVPPAMNLQILADLVGGGGPQMALIIAITYLTAVVSLTAWIAVFLYAIHEGGLLPA